MILLAQPWPAPAGWWRQAAGWLEPAVRRGGECDLAHVERLLAAGEAQLFLALDAGAVRAALVTTRHGGTLHLWLCGGRGCDWPALLADVLAWARLHGVRRWSVDGRPGWRRVLKGLADGQEQAGNQKRSVGAGATLHPERDGPDATGVR